MEDSWSFQRENGGVNNENKELKIKIKVQKNPGEDDEGET